MDLDTFSELIAQRLPSADELVSFIESQGWRIEQRENGTASLRADTTDPVATRMANMLRKEPFRSQVLQAAQMKWRRQEHRPREWKTENGFIVREKADDPDDAELWSHPDRHPPYCTHWRCVGESEWIPLSTEKEECDLSWLGATA